WLRSVLFTGFPWMDLGYGMWRTPLLLQSADVFGHHFLTFLIVFVNGAVFFLVSKCGRQNGGKGRSVIAVVTTVLLAVVVVYGSYRTTFIEHIVSEGEKMSVGIVQGNIDQSEKWAPALQERTINIYLERSRQLLQKPPAPDLIVWPETALPFFPSRSDLFGAVPRLAREGDVALLTGSPWFEVIDAEKGLVNFYNSAFILGPSGEYMGRYSKSHLVPFGEYVPLKQLLFFLAPLVEAVGDFTPGNIERPLTAQKAHCGILICYESIFPAIARKWVENGANLFINLTNDAWYGRSSAPYQSMAMSVVRAVESRRSMVRAANTGISGFVDPLGRVKASSALFVDWAESHKVALLQHRSFYSRYGYLFGPVCFLLAIVMSGCLLYAGKK
ncbi:MAG: apolipoprotein N-acyltransferase, partial [Desulfopila sp.]